MHSIDLSTKRKGNSQMSTITPILTKWGENLNKHLPLSSYPRPQLKRDNWVCLNGVWEYAFSENEPAEYTGEIIVPFSPESLLSGVSRELSAGQTIWYKRSFKFDKIPSEHRLLLHFGAVDQYCEVFVNGEHMGGFEGGYWPFHFDITDIIAENPEKEAEIIVAAWDDGEKGIEAFGKQSTNRGGIWYTAQSGIWQTVWAEVVPEQHVRDIKITPQCVESTVEIELTLSDLVEDEFVHISVYDENAVFAEIRHSYLELKKVRDEENTVSITIPLPGFKYWSPDNPFLYTLKIKTSSDLVESYFGMRQFGIENGRLMLNGEPIFHTGLLDQGYWSDGMYTPPDDEAMIFDIVEAKKLGYNMLRKHIKIEPLRWYYHCDRLGMLVWQDFVNGGGPYSDMLTRFLPFADVRIKDDRLRSGFGRMNPKGMQVFERDLIRTVKHLYNCVSLCVWVPFNEGWGQFEANRITEKLRAIDATRSIDHASGWHDQGGGDFASHHVYYKPFKFKADKFGRVQALTKFGGYSMQCEGHTTSDKLFGQRMFRTKEGLTKAIKKLYETDVLPYIEKGLSAAIYTQLSDVEDEVNGLFTYDRAKLKIDSRAIWELNNRLIQTLLYEKETVPKGTRRINEL